MSLSGKTLDSSPENPIEECVKDLKKCGNPHQMKLLFKASSEKEGWMKSTKAMQIDYAGCVVQITTQQGNNIAEAVTFVPGVCIVEDEDGGRKLVAASQHLGALAGDDKWGPR